MKPPVVDGIPLEDSYFVESAFDATAAEETIMEFNREDFWFAGIMAFCIVVALVGVWATTRFIPEGYHVRHALALTACEALMVAAFLGTTVDIYLRKALIRRVSNDVFKYLAGYGLPDEIKQRIRALMGTSLIRHDWKISYVLTPIAESDEVFIDVRYSFDLENVSNETTKYMMMVQSEKRLNPRILELRCDDPDRKFRMAAVLGGSLGKDEEGLPGVIEARGPEINIKPSGRNAGLKYPFSGHYQLRTPSNGNDTFSFGHVSVGVTITTQCPSEYAFSIEAEPDTIVTENMWQFRKRAFLRSEHVMVRWFKTSNGTD